MVFHATMSRRSDGVPLHRVSYEGLVLALLGNRSFSSDNKGRFF